jgi:cellulose synthase/poly-beta-1,6-N-acetylglucosamine synthase-like glycosyltransferase
MSALEAIQVGLLVYFVVLNLVYSALSFVGLRLVVVHARELSDLALRDLLEREVYRPVSILVPAYNEERTIVAAVRSFLALQYPRFEVIVVSDGSTDRTVEALTEAFALVEDPRVWSRSSRRSRSAACCGRCATPTSSSWTRRTGGSPTR